MNTIFRNTFFFIVVLISVLPVCAQNRPVYRVGPEEKSLQQLCAPYLAMSSEALLALVPPQAGFYFSGSPASDKGAQENNISWEPSLGQKVLCKFSGTLLPNERFPENGYVELTTPTGKKQRFNYYQDPTGKKYWFEARRWYEQMQLMERTAYQLAQLYSADPLKYKEAGLRSIAIMKRFAEVYPDYIVKYDHPGHDKLFFDKTAFKKASQKIDHYFIRLTKWSWWGYSNISRQLLLAYDQIQGSDILSEPDRKEIVALFDGMLDFADPYAQVPLTNMHPSLWETQMIASRVLDRPALTQQVLQGLRRILKEQYTYDGFYKEATVSYSNQTISGLKNVLRRLFPELGDAELDAKIKSDFPDMYRTFQSNTAFRLPNGGYASVNDTWASDRYRVPPILQSKSALMPGMGHAVLAGGAMGDQMQAHINYSGRFGHDHYGSLGLILFGKGKELVSDLGYTHTRARTWASSTAAHNTVVVDGESQQRGAGPRFGMGDLLLYQTQSPEFQAVEVKADEVYPGKVSDYRRTLIMVQTSGEERYVVDLFHVKGGERHDWILHGSADDSQSVEIETEQGKPFPMQSKLSLLPDGYEFKELKEQGGYNLLWEKDWAFGHFKNTKQGHTKNMVKATFRYKNSKNPGFQTWLLGGTEQQIITGESWNVRGAKEDQGILDAHLRSSLLIRRQGGGNLFVAVHVPFLDKPFVKNVRQQDVSENGLLLRIDHLDGTDYIGYQKGYGKQRAVIEGKSVDLDGSIVLLRYKNGKFVKKMMIAPTKSPARLLTTDASSITVDGDFKVQPGGVIRVQHGDGHTTAFEVASVHFSGRNTRIVTKEPVTLMSVADGKLKLESFPFMEYAGPHTVSTDLLQIR